MPRVTRIVSVHQVCDPSADLTLRSSDGILFKVSSKDHEAYSEAFPSPDIVKPDANEIVVLSETSQVLELLLQCIVYGSMCHNIPE